MEQAKRIKNIIREVPAEQSDFSFYFDGDCFKESGFNDFCGNLFVITSYRGIIGGFNHEVYEDIMSRADNFITDYEYTKEYIENGDRDIFGKPTTYKHLMELYGIPYSPKKCHDIKEWAESADTSETEDIALWLELTTGKEWKVESVHGYCQGDYAEVLYCPDFYEEKTAEACGEIWLGCGKEFCVIDLDENGEEIDSGYGFIVADCEVDYSDSDASYKKIVCEWEGLDPNETQLEMIDREYTVRKCDYRVA